MNLFEQKLFPLRLDWSTHTVLAATAKRNNRSMQAEVMDALSNAIPEIANPMQGLSNGDRMYFNVSPRKKALLEVTAYAQALSEECHLLEQWLQMHRAQLSNAVNIQRKLIEFDPSAEPSVAWNSVAIPAEDLLKKQKPPSDLKYAETFPILKIERDAVHRAKGLLLARHKSTHRLSVLVSAIEGLNLSEPKALE